MYFLLQHIGLAFFSCGWCAGLPIELFCIIASFIHMYSDFLGSTGDGGLGDVGDGGGERGEREQTSHCAAGEGEGSASVEGDLRGGAQGTGNEIEEAVSDSEEAKGGHVAGE